MNLPFLLFVTWGAGLGAISVAQALPEWLEIAATVWLGVIYMIVGLLAIESVGT